MPRIYDNIERALLPDLQQTLASSHRADSCVGYFNLRGWKHIDELIGRWPGGDGNCCRLLVGMQRPPEQQLQDLLGITHDDQGMDLPTAKRLKHELALKFREQLTFGVPTAADEAGLRRLAAQITAKQVVVKLFLRHPLHAKLYLNFRQDHNNPITGYLGSSNLTFAGLSKQGELNVDVLDHDATEKLAKWFNNRWDDPFCLDISQELVDIINHSWAGAEPVPPYHVYLKMAYHLSKEALAGLSEFSIPDQFQGQLFEFQEKAVRIAARHLDLRGGVLIGDVVGLGKTLVALALAKIFELRGLETLFICPKNLVPMWESYRLHYALRGTVLSLSRAEKELTRVPQRRGFPAHRVVLIDESHNLRNRAGKRYKAIADYIDIWGSKVILLSATPYNKTLLDISNQLRLFMPGTRGA